MSSGDKKGSRGAGKLIVRGRDTQDMLIQRSADAARSHQFTEEDLQRPSTEAVESNTERTRREMARIAGEGSGVSTSARRTQAPKIQTERQMTMAVYQPHVAGGRAKNVAVMEAARDPLEPPRTKVKRLPRELVTQQAPLLQEAQAKLTAQEKELMRIPASVSNFKNKKANLIPLEMRVGADGRRMNEKVISEEHLDVAEALNAAERKAAVEGRERAKLRELEEEKRKQEEEEDLQQQAQQALAARQAQEREVAKRRRGETQQERDERLRREAERRERERELRREQLKKEKLAQKLGIDVVALEKDVHEQSALGMLSTMPQQKGDTLEAEFDTRILQKAASAAVGSSTPDDEYAGVSLFPTKAAYRPTKDRIEREIQEQEELERQKGLDDDDDAKRRH